MTAGIDMAAVATLVGDPGRANMLATLLDGRSHTATELTRAAGLQASTASGHLAKLAQGRLISVVPQGRHRFYRLASTDVARMLETIMVVAADGRQMPSRATPRIDTALRRARACYDHLAGELGVALADALVGRRMIELNATSASVTKSGRRALASAGLTLKGPPRSRRVDCRPCLDWSERRPHVAGMLGSLLLERALAVGVVRRRQDGRALDVLGDPTDLLNQLGLS